MPELAAPKLHDLVALGRASAGLCARAALGLHAWLPDREAPVLPGRSAHRLRGIEAHGLQGGRKGECCKAPGDELRRRRGTELAGGELLCLLGWMPCNELDQLVVTMLALLDGSSAQTVSVKASIDDKLMYSLIHAICCGGGDAGGGDAV